MIEKNLTQSDLLDIAIKEKIKEILFITEWSKDALSKIRYLQINYLREVIGKIEDQSWVYNRTQSFLKEASTLLKANIIEGNELLEEIPVKSSVLVVTNHLGLDKLTTIDTKKDLGLNMPDYPLMSPSPIFFGGVYPVAEALGDNLSYVSNDFPGVFGEIHRASGFIHVPSPALQQTNRTEVLLDQTKDIFKLHSNTAIVNFPEGGTSGKRNKLGPYDLEPFKTGGYVIASKLGVKIIPVAQYFDPNKGLQLKVFKPYTLALTDRSGYEKQANEDREKMQEWLNVCKTYKT